MICVAGLAIRISSVIVNYNTKSPYRERGASARVGRYEMSKLSPYVNEIISFVVMLLLVAALVSGQMSAQAYKLASVEAAADDRVEVRNFRLEDE